MADFEDRFSPRANENPEDPLNKWLGWHVNDQELAGAMILSPDTAIRMLIDRGIMPPSEAITQPFIQDTKEKRQIAQSSGAPLAALPFEGSGYLDPALPSEITRGYTADRKVAPSTAELLAAREAGQPPPEPRAAPPAPPTAATEELRPKAPHEYLQDFFRGVRDRFNDPRAAAGPGNPKPELGIGGPPVPKVAPAPSPQVASVAPAPVVATPTPPEIDSPFDPLPATAPMMPRPRPAEADGEPEVSSTDRFKKGMENLTKVMAGLKPVPQPPISAVGTPAAPRHTAMPPPNVNQLLQYMAASAQPTPAETLGRLLAAGRV